MCSYLAWRKKEQILIAQAINEPDKLTVIRIDDTTAISLPHPGNRIPKSLGQKSGPEVGDKNMRVTGKILWCSRSLVVVWCTGSSNIGRGRWTGEEVVFLVTLESYQKGRKQVCLFHWLCNCGSVLTGCGCLSDSFDRFCTILWHVIKANREEGTDHSLARKLVIIADNYSENRNYCVVMHFAAELVWYRWYDEVENLFGKVGHTHGGQDGTHHELNTYVLKSPHEDLGSLLKAFERVWYSDFVDCR